MIFWVSTATILYTYIGYPVLIGIAGKLASRPVTRNHFEPEVTIIISALNEGKIIAQRIENLLSQDYCAEKLRIIVTSDGSTDDTDKQVSAYIDDRVSLLTFDKRRGKAACLNDAVANCQTDYIVFADARQRFASNALRKLMENFADQNIGAVSGELIIESDIDTDSGFSHGVDFYWRYEKFIRQSEAHYASVVGATGAIYALRKALFKPLPHGLILDDVLTPMNVVRAGKRVGFEPEAKAFDIAAPNPQWEQRRKIRTIAGNYQLLKRSPELLLPGKNPIWWQFISHKVLRLVAPAFLLSALISNIPLAGTSGFYGILLGIQILFYSAALAGIFVPATHKLVPVRIAMTFCCLNWAAILGFREFFARRSAQLW